jgi:hypothetical protein
MPEKQEKDRSKSTVDLPEEAVVSADLAAGKSDSSEGNSLTGQNGEDDSAQVAAESNNDANEKPEAEELNPDEVPELDLEEGQGPPEDGAVVEPEFKEVPPADKVRAQVARALVAILAIVIFFSFLTMWMFNPPPKVEELEKLLTIVFGPLVALVSGAVGYYFGGKVDGP